MNSYNLALGTVVNVIEYAGLSRVEWSGPVTWNDPTSPRIFVSGIAVSRASVEDANV